MLLSSIFSSLLLSFARARARAFRCYVNASSWPHILPREVTYQCRYRPWSLLFLYLPADHERLYCDVALVRVTSTYNENCVLVNMTATECGKGVDSSSQDARSRVTLEYVVWRSAFGAGRGRYVCPRTESGSAGRRGGGSTYVHHGVPSVFVAELLDAARPMHKGHSYVSKDPEITCIYTRFAVHTAQHHFRGLSSNRRTSSHGRSCARAIALERQPVAINANASKLSMEGFRAGGMPHA